MPLSTSTLGDQVGGGAHALLPIYRLIEAHVLAAERLHGDDTTVPVLAKGKTWDEETFTTELADWNVKFYEAEVEVLRPMVQGDGLIQLMQKNMPEDRVQAILAKFDSRHE